jgi:hypothetical protein
MWNSSAKNEYLCTFKTKQLWQQQNPNRAALPKNNRRRRPAKNLKGFQSLPFGERKIPTE